MKRDSDEDTNELEVALICKKINHGRKPKSIAVTINFTDPDGPIEVSEGTFDPSSDLTKAAMSLNSRIKQALAHGAKTRSEIALLLDVDQDIVRNTMNKRQNKDGYRGMAGDKWGLAL